MRNAVRTSISSAFPLEVATWSSGLGTAKGVYFRRIPFPSDRRRHAHDSGMPLKDVRRA